MNTASPPSTGVPGFAGLGVPLPLVELLSAQGITEPFPIQSSTLPDALRGRDVLGRGRTGSGKTVAFSLPTVIRLSTSGGQGRPRHPRALVLVPTRELATQVLATMAPLAKALRLRTVAIVGGVNQGPQVEALRRGTEIVVATPGRLEDLMRQGVVDLSQVEVVVIDEADHMADLGFLPPVRRILDATPKGGQRLLFSATIDASVDVIVRNYLNSPVVHSVDEEHSPVPAMEHHLVTVAPEDKSTVVRELVSGTGRTIAFTRTKHGASKLARQLSAAGVPAVDLHGNLTQSARRRNLARFVEGDVRVLVATDIAARGIHVDDVNLVVHVDPPAEHKAYLHRSGRTARAGNEGIVVTVGLASQRGDVNRLMKRAAITPATHSVSPGDDVIEQLVGPAAPLRKVAPRVVEPPRPRGASAKRGAPATRGTSAKRGAPETSTRRRTERTKARTSR